MRPEVEIIMVEDGERSGNPLSQACHQRVA